METLLGWLLRVTLIATGAGAALLIAGWIRDARRSGERWPVRLALAMITLAAIYGVGHGRMLIDSDRIEEGRARYVRFGDPRRTEMRRAEVRGWILDCTSRPDNALARYAADGGAVDRVYPLGEAGANFIGGGNDADLRDYTIERVFSEELRRPRGLVERGELHPVGTDLHLTLCGGATARAWELLRESDRPGAVIVQDVESGALVAYASTGGPDDPPLGLREYAAPGSIWKLALATLWWEHGLPERPMGCESTIQVTPRSSIRNSEGFSIPSVMAPTEMLVYSCNTTAVRMALEMREQLGEGAFAEVYERFGITPYAPGEAPGGYDHAFWRTASSGWRDRMSPPPARARLSGESSTQEWAQLAIGQGPIDVTPIHMARLVAAIGNGGVMVTPTIEERMLDDDPDGRRIMSPGTAEKLLLAMTQVVDHGSARSTAPILEGLEWDLAGKTGTAQVQGAADNGWFAGLALDPEGRPRYAIVSFLVGGGPGGRRPAAIAAGLTRYFASSTGEDPSRTEGAGGES